MAEAPAALRRYDSILGLPIDFPTYLSDLLVEPGPELRSWTPPVSDRIAYWTANRLEDLGVQPRKAMSVGIGTRDILGNTPMGIPMAVGDATHALSRGDYAGASLAALPIVPAARLIPKPVQHAAREALFDLSNLNILPNRPQFDLPRYSAPRGVPERTKNLLLNRKSHDELMKIIEAGKQNGALGWPNTTPLQEPWRQELGSRGDEALRNFLGFVAGASAKTDLVQNIRNASHAYHLHMSGKGLPEVGIANPHPYGHIAQRNHQMHARRVAEGLPFDSIKNPKPASYYQNVDGNYRPVMADAHLFRTSAMAAEDPRFLKTRYQPSQGGPVRNIREEVTSGNLSIEEALKNPAFWEDAPRLSEYAAFEQLWQELARKADVAPAQAQSAVYLSGTKKSGSSSAHYPSFVHGLNDRIHETATKEKMDPPDVRKRFIVGQMPLISGAGLVAAGVATQGSMSEDQNR